MRGDWGFGIGDWRLSSRGVTLVELLVVLVLLGLIFSVTGLALASLTPSRSSEVIHMLEAARARAIRFGQPTSVLLDTAGSATDQSPILNPRQLLFLPDGRALGPGIDPLTGTPGARR